jgi:hypothetical protein
MREIKFRAWDVVDGEMWEWPSLVQSGFKILVDPAYKIMQYTGLKDKNGKEIYEGDILGRDYWCAGNENDPRYWPRKDRIEVKADQHYKDSEDNDHYGWSFSGYELEGWPGSETTLKQDPYVVIGNIYENPEMLA